MPKENNKTMEKIGEEVLHADEQVFEFELEDPHYKGTFKAKLQTIGTSFEIMARARKILSSYGIASGEDRLLENLAYEVAVLDVLLIDRPKWMKSIMEVTDWNLVHALYEKVNEFLTSFRPTQ